MWAAILRVLTGNIAGQLTRAYEMKLKAANETERLAADIEIRRLEAVQQSIIQAQRDRAERWVRIAFAAPFAIYINKIVIWDKVIGWGATDPLSDMLTQIMWTVIGGYFLISTAKVIRK